MARGPIDPLDIRSVKALYVDPLVRNYSELGFYSHAALASLVSSSTVQPSQFDRVEKHQSIYLARSGSVIA
jgi:hypothetical protein